MRAFLVAFVLWSGPTAFAADISILNSNAAGEGLNDPTPVVAVGLNFGVTRGQQATIALQYAATIWAATLRSTVPIVIDSAFVTPAEDSQLSCTSTEGILGITSVPSFFSGMGLPVSGAAYPVALANALLGQDLTPGEAHILSRFNASVGSPNCLQGASFYFGLEGFATGAQRDAVSVFLHEFAHGFGFLSVVNPSTGHFANGQPAIFDFHVWDVGAGSTWQDETDAQRQALADDNSGLSLEGTELSAAIPGTLDYLPTLSVDAPGFQNPVPFAEATFSGPFLLPGGTIVPAEPLNGCSDFTNAASLAGNIALIERGNADAGVLCRFWDKANRAQDAGVAAVILFNNQPGAPLVTPTGSPTLTIPVGFVSLETGTAILEDTGSVRGTFGQSALRAGVDTSGRGALLYTPSTVIGASSVSHFGTSAVPALLMEPSIQSSVMRRLDLTPAALGDLGWSVVRGLSVVIAKALDQHLVAGQDPTYLLTLVNNRPDAATAVTLDIALPTGASIASSVGACANGFPCSLGTVDAGAVSLSVVTVHLSVPASEPFVVTATANSATLNPEDVLTSTSTLSNTSSSGCSSSAGADAPVLVVLLVFLALVSLRRQRPR